MATEKLMAAGGPKYVQMRSSPPSSPPPTTTADIASLPSFRYSSGEVYRIFDELPKANIVSVSRPDASDISPMQLSYTIQVQYKQVRQSLSDFVELFKIEDEKFLISISDVNCVN
jgi:phospholipase D1/2